MPDLKNRIDEAYKNNGSYQPQSLNDAENISNTDAGAGIDQLEAYANDPANATKLRDEAHESESNTNSSWNNNYAKPASKTNSSKAFLRKAGPMGLIGGTLAGGGLMAAVFLTPAAVIVNLKEKAVNTYDQQATTYEPRANRLMVKKIMGSTTTSSCTVTTILCKFTRPSNNLLKSLSDAQIEVFNSKGESISKRSLLPNERPATLKLPDGRTINASQLQAELRSNASLRSAFDRGTGWRRMSWNDSVATKVLKKFNITRDSPAKDATTSDEAKTKITEASKGVTSSTEEIKTMMKDRVTVMLEKAGRKVAKNADPVLLIGVVGCLMSDVPGFVTKVSRDYQLLQLARYGFIFLTIADKIKAGDATPEEVGAAGAILTTAFVAKGSSNRASSAMDSFGIHNMLFKDTGTKGFNSDYRKMIPGVGDGSAIGQLAAATSNPELKKACSLITSPQAMVAASSFEAAAGVATGGVAAIGTAVLKAGLKVAAAIGAIEVIINLLTPLITTLIDLIPFDKILGLFMGDLTSNIQGEDAGNAIASGVSNQMAEVANVGGNAPLTKGQIVAYSQFTKQIQLARQEQDRQTHSPFDASNPNTFLGSIASTIGPHLINITGGSLVSSLGAISRGTISNFSAAAYADSASATTTEYSMCPDPSIASTDVAAGPFCNIQYGVPVKYLDRDPEEVVNRLIKAGQVDETTGEPIPGSDLEEWYLDCNNGDTDAIAGCTISGDNESTYADYALYAIDHRAQKNMDGEDSASTSSSSSNSNANITDGWTEPITTYSNHGSYGYMESTPRGTHKGVDYMAPAGTPVYAAHDGEIVYAQLISQACGNGYVIKAADTMYLIYQHINLSGNPTVGTKVTAGQQIGTVADFGSGSSCVSGNHLHFQLQTTFVSGIAAYATPGDGNTLDPYQYVPKKASSP